MNGKGKKSGRPTGQIVDQDVVWASDTTAEHFKLLELAKETVTPVRDA